MKKKKVNQESVLDFAQEGLCTEVWQQDYDGNWDLKPGVRDHLQKVFVEVCTRAKLNPDNMAFNITGSITSNTYTVDSDIDLHIHFIGGIRIRETDEMTQSRFREAFNQLSEENPEIIYINQHPIEVYYQPNEIQDHMSIGCYDFFEEKWIVGPELKDADYNPWKEIYPAAIKQARHIMADIRDTILDVYEKALAIVNAAKSEDIELVNTMLKDLHSSLKEAKEIFVAAKKMRQAYSMPKDDKQAAKWRKSKKWLTVDTAFKFMDKLGYLGILKTYSMIAQEIPTIEDAEAITHMMSFLRQKYTQPNTVNEQQYDPPYTLEQIKANYPKEIYLKLANDPVHRWRAKTGIELIHKEPTQEELERIWKNWQLMSPMQKEISDKKSLELFGVTNYNHYKALRTSSCEWLASKAIQRKNRK